ncbi:6-bladed beta-propeller [Paenibacillus sp. M.A.Huq-81]
MSRRKWKLNIRGLIGAILTVAILFGMFPAMGSVSAAGLQFKPFISNDADFIKPSQFAHDANGHIFVSDIINHQILKFDASGSLVKQWGTAGNGDGQFQFPNGIAVDSSGNVYVADTVNHRIQKFDSDGGFLSKWGTLGSNDGQLNMPYGIAIDSNDKIYVVDQSNHRIQTFNSDGSYVAQWGSLGSGLGQFQYPSGIAISSNGHLYITDYFHRVQKFDLNGTPLTQWGSLGSGDGQFNVPVGIAVDGNGNVYVADRWNHRIQKFSSDGVFLEKWGSLGGGSGQLNSPHGVAVDSNGNIYVADTLNFRYQKLSSNGSYLSQWGKGNGQLSHPSDIEIDSNGNLYVTDTGNARIQKYDANGTFLAKWGEEGNTAGKFGFALEMAIDSHNDIYVVDLYNHNIQKFDANGVFITAWGSNGTGDGQFNGPTGIAIDSRNNVYVTDQYNNRIQKFDSNGVFLAKWGSVGNGEGQLNWPTGIAIDSNDNLYVAEHINKRIQKFDSNGTFIAAWGSQGSGNGKFMSPHGVEVDTSGNVYVVDAHNYHIQKFDSNGVYLEQWGSQGSGEGQFHYPLGAGIDSRGNVYVTDFSAHQIQVLNVGPEQTPPTVADGALLASSITSSALKLNWNKATDNESAQGALEYLVYRSNSPNIATVSEMELNGTPIEIYAANIGELNVTGLAAHTAYFFNLIVKDEAGNKSAYTMKQVSTSSVPLVESIPPNPAKPTIDLNGKPIDPDLLDTKKPSVTLEVEPKNGSAYAVIPAKVLEELQSENASFVIELGTPFGSYQVPVRLASLISGLTDTLAAHRLKTDEISFKITLTDQSGDSEIQEALAGSMPNSETIGSIVDYKVEIVHAVSGKTIAKADLFKEALIRTITLPDQAHGLPAQWGAFRYNETTKQFEFVPAQTVQNGKKWTVVIRSDSNSAYVVAHHPVSFTDMQQHWSQSAVKTLAAKGLMNGRGGSRFNPEGELTRAEMSALLVRASGRTAEAKGEGHPAPYNDVSAGAWYYDEVVKANELGLLNRFEQGSFTPNRAVTREELSSMLASFIQIEGLTLPKAGQSFDGYKDIGSVDPARLADVRLMVELGIMTGTANAAFNPKGRITRAEAATVFVRLLQAAEWID